MPCVAGQCCKVPANIPAPPFYTNHKCGGAAGICGLCGILNPEFDDKLKRVCKVCVSPCEKPEYTTRKKPQSSSSGTSNSLGKNGTRMKVVLKTKSLPSATS